MKRRPLSSIIGERLTFRLPTAEEINSEDFPVRHGCLVIESLDSPGSVVGIVGRNHLYDADGNYFEDDI